MEFLRRRRFPAPDRFLGLFVRPEAAADEVELHEDEVLWNGPGSPEPNRSPAGPAISPSAAAFHDRAAGILAFLLDDDKKRGGSSVPFLHRTSSTTSVPEAPNSMPAGKIYRHSVPVSVPVRAARRPSAMYVGWDEDDDDDDDEMLPPHEIVARSPMTAFSVLEGAGRTLKGRDLCRVRNAVLRQTGFLD